MDTIFIREFRADAQIGIYEWERRSRQTVEIDLEIGLPGRDTPYTDEIGQTVDYAAVIGRIERMLDDERFGLIERLAERIAAIVLDEFGAPRVRVGVTKLGLFRRIKRIGISIERHRAA